MCSRLISKRMDNYQGDLTDILRASGSSNPAGQGGGGAAPALPEWQFPDTAITYAACPGEDFGQPFPFLRDPLVNDPPASGFFHPADVIRDETAGFAAVGVNESSAMRIIDDHEKRPPNIFSRMLQISPTAKLSGESAAALALPGPPQQRGLMSPNNSKSCLIESPGLQIPSPRNTGIRRRKSQAKKVVCIPAPAPANSRSTGEVVPSDLWAWRKYGQKPIKGSPYPRGYYRCSSSKGCSARKQVERSRTDPNMLVITYTSEHNHPWPTQRNALAGSTRSQPSKTPTAAKTSPTSQSQKPSNPKEEQAELTGSALVKEEMDQDFDNQLEVEDHDFQRSYKPMLPEANPSDDSFFADLGEIESDSLDMLLFDGRDTKGLDPFSFYDWSVNTAAPGSSAAAGAAASSSGASSRRDL